MKSVITAAVLGLATLSFVGCASKHEEGVKSDYRSQWTSVAADTTATTDAAKSVLEERGLKNVTGTSTKLDGKAMGKMADNTNVNVAVTKDGMGSQVSVTVGVVGDPKVGAEIAKAIKMRAEGTPGGLNPTTRRSSDMSGNMDNTSGTRTMETRTTETRTTTDDALSR